MPDDALLKERSCSHTQIPGTQRCPLCGRQHLDASDTFEQVTRETLVCLSLRRESAVDRESGAGDEVRRRAREEDSNSGEVLGHAPAAGWRAREHLLVQPAD